jgi:hypothetical protein
MDNDKLTLFGGLNVQFKGIGPEAQALLEGRKGILWRQAGAATMRKKKRLVVGQVGVPRAAGGCSSYGWLLLLISTRLL